MSNAEQQPPQIRVRSDYDSLRDDIDEVKDGQKDDRVALWKAIDDIRDKHGERLSALERWQWFCYGIAATAGAIAAWLLEKFGIKQ